LRFNVVVSNDSNVTVKYRTIIQNDATKDTGLFTGLDVSVANAPFAGSIVSDWTAVEPESQDVIIPVEIVLPADAGNDYQGKACEINVLVEAVQGNADVKDSYVDNGDGTYDIGDAYGMFAFAKDVNSGNDYAGKTINLTADIDLANAAWTSIGNWDNAFAGVFNGNNYTISNLNVVNTDEEAGSGVALFGVAVNAEFKDINIKNVNANGYDMTAALVGSPYTGCSISNCHVSGEINIKSEYAYAGGIFAYGYVSADNCSVIADGTGYITAKDRNAVGGIAAWMLEGANSITNCDVKNLELTGWANIGSITGFIHYNNVLTGCTAENVKITKTRDGGNGTLGYAAGGWSYGTGKTITISDNSFTNVSINGNYVANANNLKGMGVMFGGEYGASSAADPASIFVMNNNVLTNVTDNRYAKATSVAELLAAIDLVESGMTVGFENDITGDATVVQKPDKAVVIDGRGFKLAGVLTVDGKSARYPTAALTVKNVNFVAESISADACIRLGISGNDNTRYTNNVTVDNCTFDVPGAVAIKSYTGGDRNLTVNNCTVTNRAHSLLQVTNVEEGLTVTGCKVYSKNGINLNSTPSIVMTGCTFDVKGYAVRVGVNGQAAFVGNYDMQNNTLKAACEDGDSVIIIRGSAVGSTLNLTGTTLTGSSTIAGATTATTIIQ